MTNRGRGDRTAQRRRHRDRYRGCRVCGGDNPCLECVAGAAVVAQHGAGRLVAVVDGAFLSWDGRRDSVGGGAGGAGLVVLLGDLSGEILVERSCSFVAGDSHDAEFQAIVRGARWAPGVQICTDSTSAWKDAVRSGIDARFLEWNLRGVAHLRARDLAVLGRQQLISSGASSYQILMPSVE